jgi:uncharacterized protein YgfB (UPF0149 family)
VSGPSYDEIQRLLGPAASAAETHGTLVGLLSTASEDLPGSWIANTLADATEGTTIPTAAELDGLAALHAATVGELSGAEMGFAPLLPADEEPLDARVEALGGWCQGYLYGLAARGLKDFGELPDEVREILGDLVQIAQAGPDEDEDDEGGERAYAELVEYVRVGVQLVYDQLMPPAESQITELQ